MGVLYGFLVIVEMVVCALLIVVIFMQKSKGGMGGSAFGGGAGEAIFGSRMGNVLTKATVVFGVIFLLNTLVLTVMTSRRGAGGSVMESAPRRPAQQQPAGAPAEGADMGWMEGEMQPPDVTMDMPVMAEDAAAGADVLMIPPAEVQEIDATPPEEIAVEAPTEEIPTADTPVE